QSAASQRPAPGDAHVGSHMCEQTDVYIFEHSIAYVVSLRSKEFLSHSRPQPDRSREVLALHHLFHRQGSHNIKWHPGIVTLTVTRRALDQRLVPPYAGLFAMPAECRRCHCPEK